MNDSQPNIQNRLTTIFIIYIALLVGQLLFFGVTFYLTADNTAEPDPDNDVFLYVALTLSLGAITGGMAVTRKKLVEIRAMSGIIQKVDAYKTMMIIQLAMLESANLFAIVSFLITANYLLAGIAGIGIAAFIALIPLKPKVLRAIEVHEYDV